MEQRFPPSFGDDYVSYRRKTEERIGTARAEQNRSIEALLALLEYRLEEGKEDLEYGYYRIFQFDTFRGKKGITRALLNAGAPCLWALTRIRYASRRQGEPRLLFSNTFLRSRRYPVVREQIEGKCGCTAAMTFRDTIRIEIPGMKDMVRESLRMDDGSVKPVFLPRFSIAGGRLQQAVMSYYALMRRQTFGQETVPEAETDAALASLREAYPARVAALAKSLRKAGLRAYITVNQYNLRDLLMIHACKEAGIPTMQQEHHAVEFCGTQFDPANPMQRLSFASHYGYWSEKEQQFHRTVFHYDNLLYPPEANRYIASGNTEMTYEQAVAYQKQYPVQRKLTFMTAGNEKEAFRTEEALAAYEEWRWAVFRGLRELAERQHITICLRYTPYREMYFREKEIPTLKSWGFVISESVPENLMEDMCSSLAVMSSTSSVLGTARPLGKMIYRVQYMDLRVVHIDDTVHEVTPETIRDIVIPEGEENKPHDIDRESFFSVDRLIAGL